MAVVFAFNRLSHRLIYNNMTWTDFHFLRPFWLLSMVPLIGLAVALYYCRSRDTQWQRWIDKSLLTHLLDDPQQKNSRWPLVGLATAWVIAAVALAGPTGEKLPQPIVQKQQSLIVLWDLSPSMLAQDIKPNRLVRSRYKLIDLLKAKREGDAALVVYGGEAHVVTPLTDDMATIIAQLPSLEPGLMPVSGSNTEMAVELALQLFADSHVFSGEILLITDGVVPRAQNTIRQLMSGSGHRLSVLAVGTEAGAPVPFGEGFAKDASGSVIIDTVKAGELEQLANKNGGKFSTLRSDNLDIEYLLNSFSSAQDTPFTSDENSSQQFDQWLELGPFIALFLLPLSALSFRRGWLLPSFLIVLPGAFLSPEAYSLEWQDLWQTKDQQAHNKLQNGDAEAAAQLFKDPRWNASAQYKSGNFEGAANGFNGDLPSDYYNKGNALAQSGDLQEALKAYDQALAADPEFEDAAYNREAVKKRLEQQQQQNQSGDDQQSDQSDSEQSQENQQGKDQQDSNQGNQSDSSETEQANSNEPQEGDQGQDKQEQEQAQSDQHSTSDSDQDAQQQNPYQNTESEDTREPNPQQQAQSDGELTDEQQQALDQWLKQIPDDPSGLLRRKFQHQHRQRRQEYRSGQWELPSNNAASRL